VNTLALASIPLVVVAAFVAWRALTGRPLRRYALNAIVALLLLVYFVITAGLGIFWVANQELPAFDVHYLFGYLTTLLVLSHVAINWRPLTRFFRKHAPAGALTADRRAWRPSVGWAARVAGLLLYGGFCYWLGLGQGATEITVTQGEVIAPPMQQQGAEAPQSGLQPPRAVRRQQVEEDGRTVSLAEFVHRRTKHTRESVRAESGRLDWSSRPSPFKKYEGAATVALPKERLPVTLTTGEAIQRTRRPVPGLSATPVSLRELATVLHWTNGLTGITKYPQVTYHLRAAPSSGALYGTETYVLAEHVAGLEPGVYHYDVEHHALQQVHVGAGLSRTLAAAAARPHLVGNAAYTLIFATNTYRQTWKYDERGWRYSLMDVGHLAAHAVIGTAALGRAASLIGRFDDRAVNALLKLEGNQESAMLIVPVGDLAPAPPVAAEHAFESAPAALSDDDVEPLVTMAMGRTFLRVGAPLTSQPFAMPVVPLRVTKTTVTLPPPVAAGAALDATIEKRRSARRFSEQPMSKAQLSSVLFHGYGVGPGQTAPTVEGARSLRLYAVVQDVTGVPPGVYLYHRGDHTLRLIRPGLDRDKTRAFGLFQDVVGQANLILVKTIAPNVMEYPDGARGYRYAAMNAGMLGGRAYLQAVGLGLGISGIGSFFDDEVSAFLGVDPADEWVIYLSAIGLR